MVAGLLLGPVASAAQRVAAPQEASTLRHPARHADGLASADRVRLASDTTPGVAQHYVTTPDGVRVAVQEYGNPLGPPIVFVHGLLGSHLVWLHQTNSPLLHRYRLITYDLRGHGLSDKPAAAAYYSEGKRWGDELHAVLAATRVMTGGARPTIVAWSMGGVVLTNYLQTYGDAGLGGLVYVDGVIELKPAYDRTDPTLRDALLSQNLRTYLDGARRFVRGWFVRQPAPATFDLLNAAAGMASPAMARAVNTRLTDPADSALPRVTVPVLLIQGADNRNLRPAMAERGHQLMPCATVRFYGGAGHASFFDRVARFDQELDVLVRTVVRTTGPGPT